MAKKSMKFKRYEEGGDVEESKAKQRGLDISNKEEPMGLFQRLRMGNIDDPTSEAYKRLGAGRGRSEQSTVSEPNVVSEPMPEVRPSIKPNPIFAAGLEQGKRQSSGDAGVAEFYANRPRNPEAEQEADNPRKTDSKPTESKTKETDKPKYENPTRGMRSDAGTGLPVQSGRRPKEEAAADQIPTGSKTKAPQGGEKIDSSETERNINAALTATGVGGAAGLFYKGKKMYDASKATKAASEAASKGREAVTNPLFWMGGPKNADKFKEAVPSAMDKAKAGGKKFADRSRKKPLNEADTTGGAIGYKRGGKIRGYASGGSVSSASKRADGIATKGKTRGKIC